MSRARRKLRRRLVNGQTQWSMHAGRFVLEKQIPLAAGNSQRASWQVSPPGRPHFTWLKAPALRLARTPRHLPHLDEELLEIARHRRVALRQRCRDAVPQREQILQTLSAVRVVRLVRHLADPVEETAAGFGG